MCILIYIKYQASLKIFLLTSSCLNLCLKFNFLYENTSFEEFKENNNFSPTINQTT